MLLPNLCRNRRGSGAIRRSVFLVLAGMVKAAPFNKKRGRYYKARPRQTAEAVIVKVTEGFGFARPDEAQEDVLYLAAI